MVDAHDEVVEKDGARVMIAPMAQMFLFGNRDRLWNDNAGGRISFQQPKRC